MAVRRPLTTRRALLRQMGSTTALGVLGCDSGTEASSAGAADADSAADTGGADARAGETATEVSGMVSDAADTSDLDSVAPDVSGDVGADTEWARGGTAGMVDRATYPDPQGVSTTPPPAWTCVPLSLTAPGDLRTVAA